jgi:hypothetical protein
MRWQRHAVSRARASNALRARNWASRPIPPCGSDVILESNRSSGSTSRTATTLRQPESQSNRLSTVFPCTVRGRRNLRLTPDLHLRNAIHSLVVRATDSSHVRRTRRAILAERTQECLTRNLGQTNPTIADAILAKRTQVQKPENLSRHLAKRTRPINRGKLSRLFGRTNPRPI